MRTYLIVIFLLLAAPLVHACNCTPPASPSEAYVQAYAVFTGKVIRAETNWMSGGMKYSIEVQQCWKQPLVRLVFVNTGWEQDCGYPFKEGESYLIYARKRFTSLETDRCMGNKLLAEAGEDLALWGEGSPPRSEGGRMVSIMNWTLTGLTLLGMLFLAFVVLRKRVMGRREKKVESRK